MFARHNNLWYLFHLLSDAWKVHSVFKQLCSVFFFFFFPRKAILLLAWDQRCQSLQILLLGPAPDPGLGPDPGPTPDPTLEAAQDPENVVTGKHLTEPLGHKYQFLHTLTS